MRRFWSWLGFNLGKHAGIVSVIGLALTIGLGAGISQLKFTTDQDSFLNKSDQAYQDNVAYQGIFGGDSMLTMFTMKPGQDVSGLLTPANIQEFQKITSQLRKAPGVYAIVSPLTAMQLSQKLVTSPTGVAGSVAGKILLGAAAGNSARAADIQKTLKRITAVPSAQQQIGNPAWDDVLLYDNAHNIRQALLPFFINKTHAQMLVRLVGHQSIEAEGQSAQAVAAIMANAHFRNATLVTTGAPALLKNINDYLRGGMLLLGGIALVVMFVILLLLFDVRWRLLPLGIVAIGLVWAFGLAGYLGIPLTLATIAGLPVMLGVGIDYSIQMHSRIEEEVILDRVEHPIQASARNLGPALLVVTFDAVFAFLALQFSKVPMLRQFGLLLAVGIAVICLCSIVSTLAVLGIREYKSPSHSRKDFSTGFLSRFVVKLGRVPAKAAIVLAVASLVIFLGGIGVEGKLVIQTDPVDWVNQHSQLIANVHAVENGIGSASELDVFVRAKPGQSVFSDSNVAYINHFEQSQTTLNASKLKPGISVISTTADLTYLEGYGDVVPKGAWVQDVYNVSPPDIQLITVANNGQDLDILFPSRTSSLDLLNTTVQGMDKVTPPAGLSVRPAGIAVVGVGLLNNLESNRTLLTYLSILFVFGFLTIRLRSVVRALLSLVPVLIAVGTAALVAYALSIKLSPATAVGGPLVVAACTEFTSLILLRFIEERSRGLDPRAAMDSTAARTGRAFVVSALTAIAGVAVVATSSLPLLRGFGIVVAFNVTIALLSALVVLPPILVWADARNWVSRGMIRPDPDAHTLVTSPDAPEAPAPVG